jgi:hypothetical protein
MSDFVEDLTIQSLQRKLKTAMEIADSATIIVLEREKQIKGLEQQLKTARDDGVREFCAGLRIIIPERSANISIAMKRYISSVEK